MTTHEIVILVEEKSSGIVIEGIASTLGLTQRVKVFKHDGFGDLKNSIPRKLNADHPDSTRFIVLCDADETNCSQRKRQIIELIPCAKRSRTIVRIACRELEAWYLAQPNAVQRGRALKSNIPKKLSSRDPDQIANVKETFLRLAHSRGQIELARKIGPHLDPNDRRSKSFGHFISALQRSSQNIEN